MSDQPSELHQIIERRLLAGKLGETSTDFEVLCRKLARMMGIEELSSGAAAPEAAFFLDTL